MGGSFRAPAAGGGPGRRLKRRRGWLAPGRAGTLLSREHSLQASNSRLLWLQPGPLSSLLLPLPDSPGDLSGSHAGAQGLFCFVLFFTSYHPLPFFKPLALAPIQPQTPLSATQPSHYFPSLGRSPLPFLPL